MYDIFYIYISLFPSIYLPVYIHAYVGMLIAGMISISGMEILFESVKSLSDTSDKVSAAYVYIYIRLCTCRIVYVYCIYVKYVYTRRLNMCGIL